jgi:hypothetical protein
MLGTRDAPGIGSRSASGAKVSAVMIASVRRHRSD